MPTTYQPIATVTLGSSASSYTFTSIPNTYTDLVLIGNGLSSTGGIAGFILEFNGDTAGNYSRTSMSGDGTNTNSDRNNNAGSANVGLMSGTAMALNTVHIMNYANTSVYKTFLARGSVSNALVRASTGLWRSTSAINAIKIYDGNGSFAAGVVLTLYGIKAA